MKRQILLLFTLLLTIAAIAQRTPTLQQAKKALSKRESLAKFTFTESDTLYPVLVKSKKGDIVIISNGIYEITGHEDMVTQRYGCLYLDAKKYSPAEIKKATDDAIKAYKDGKPFEAIISQYHPENAKELSDIEASSAILERETVTKLDACRPGDIFVAKNNFGTYVIVKNAEPFMKKAVQVLYVEYY